MRMQTGRKQKLLLVLFLAILVFPCLAAKAAQKQGSVQQGIRPSEGWIPWRDINTMYEEEELRILIVGNSLVGYHDMGSMLRELAQAGGYSVSVELLWKNGCPLYRYASVSHSMGQRLRNLLISQEWDYVIFQENTPSLLRENSSTAKAAQRLAKLARKYGAEPIFLETWAPEEGHRIYQKDAYQGVSRKQLQTRIRRLFRNVGRTNQAEVIWAGELFWALRSNKKLDLIGTDYKHPTVEGSYAIACACYVALFQENPPAWSGSLEASRAKAIRRAAAQYCGG